MAANDLAAKVKSLHPEQRQVVESLVNLLINTNVSPKRSDLSNHPSFGAWAAREDLPSDSDEAARELRKRAGRRESA